LSLAPSLHIPYRPLIAHRFSRNVFVIPQTIYL
jgi:hypothetical protein